MTPWTRRLASAATMIAAVLLGACSDNNDDLTAVRRGNLVVRLTDAASLTDSLQSVNLYVVRVDGRITAASDVEAASNVDDPDRGGWITLATPNASFNLLALRDRISDAVGEVTVTAGTYNGFRIVIDPARSSVTLKSGRVLTSASTPGILFPSANRTAIRIVPSKPVVVAGETTTLIVDVDVNASFVQRGNSVERNGLSFTPVIRATIIDPGTVTASVRLINLSRAQLALRQDGNGTTRLALDRVSRCLTVNTAQSLFVNKVGSNTNLIRFGPELVPGFSYVIFALDLPSGGVRFVTIPTTFVPTAGRVGLRVFNATGLTNGFDVFVSASGAPVSAATVANVLGDSISAFVSVPAGLARIRVTNAGGTTVVLDLDAQPFAAGQNATLILVPPLLGLTAVRSFLVAGC